MAKFLDFPTKIGLEVCLDFDLVGMGPDLGCSDSSLMNFDPEYVGSSASAEYSNGETGAPDWLLSSFLVIGSRIFDLEKEWCSETVG